MLVRALRLRSEIDDWTSSDCNSGSFTEMHLSDEEWEHVCYLLFLLYPYYTWTEKLSITSWPTIHKAWAVYTALFEHLEEAEGRLLMKKEAWKVSLADSVVAAHRKLSQYYSNTDGPRGQIYNLATVLDPTQRLTVYQSKNFEPQLHRQYDKEFRQVYKTKYLQLDKQDVPRVNSAPPTARMSFTALATSRMRPKTTDAGLSSQLNDYLRAEVTEDDDPLAFWRSREETAPGLAQMAKDILAIPIARVGVERIFSAARRVCGYQRHRLSPETIRKIIVVREWEMVRERHNQDMVAVVDIPDSTGDECVEPTYGDADYEMAEKQDISDDEEEDDAPGGGGSGS